MNAAPEIHTSIPCITPDGQHRGKKREKVIIIKGDRYIAVTTNCDACKLQLGKDVI